MPAGFMTYKPAENLPSNAFVNLGVNRPKHIQEGQTCVSHAVAHVCEYLYNREISDKCIADFHRKCVEYGFRNPSYYYTANNRMPCGYSGGGDSASSVLGYSGPARVSVIYCPNYGGKCLVYDGDCPKNDGYCNLDNETICIGEAVSCLEQFHVIEGVLFYVPCQLALLKNAIGGGGQKARPIVAGLKVFVNNVSSVCHSWNFPTFEIPEYHTLALVGYYDLTDNDGNILSNSKVNYKQWGGGFFIAKNSWASKCDNSDFQCLGNNKVGETTLAELANDYDFISYEYVRRYCDDAIGIIPIKSKNAKASSRKWLTLSNGGTAEYELRDEQDIIDCFKNEKQWNSYVYHPEFGVKRVWEVVKIIKPSLLNSFQLIRLLKEWFRYWIQ